MGVIKIPTRRYAIYSLDFYIHCMKRLLFVFIVLLFSVTVLGQDSLAMSKTIYYDGKTAIFPVEWLAKKINAKATPAATEKFRQDTVAVSMAFDKYPSWVLQKELGVVYIVGKLRFSAQYFTGTNSTNNIYIGSDGNNEIEKTFHHEFSSILLRNYSDIIFEMQWKEKSPELLSVSSAAAVKSGLYSIDYDEKLLVKGYLGHYSLSNWENDFNMYAENIFAGGKAFWKIADRYPKVLEKTKLIVKFYKEKIWSGFTENYFRFAADD